MADDFITREQFETFMNEMRRSNAAVERMSRSVEQNSQKTKATGERRTGNRDDARMRLERDMNRPKARQTAAPMQGLDKSYRGFARGLEGAGRGIALLGSNADQAGSALTRFAGVFAMGGVVGGIVAGATNLINIYRDMADVGQSFQGSMFSMGRAAAEAGMPLADFGAMVKKSSKAMAFFGADTVGRVTKQVRQMTEKTGMFGYTMEGLNDVTTAYMDQQRIFGNNRRLNEASVSANSIALAKNMSGLSAVFGTSREEILRTTQEAMTSSSMIGRAMTMTGDQLQSFSAVAQASVQTMAAIPGEGGRMMANFMSDTIGQQQSLYARGADTFIQAGMSNVLHAANALQRNLELAGDDTDKASALTFEFTKTLRTEIDRNLPVLRLMAAQGDAAANEILQLSGSLSKMSDEQIRAAMKENEAKGKLTANLLSLGNVFNRLSGSVLTGIFKVFEAFEGGTGGDLSAKMVKFEEAAEKIGASLGRFALSLDPDKVAEFINSFGSAMIGLGKVASWAADVFGKLISAISAVNDFFGGNIWATIGAGIAALVVAKVGIGLTKNLFGKWMDKTFAAKVNIDAAQVIVNGGIGLGGGGRGRGRGRGRGGRGRGRGPGPRGGGGGVRPSGASRQPRLRGAARRRAAMAAAAAGGGSRVRAVTNGGRAFGAVAGASTQVARVGRAAGRTVSRSGGLVRGAAGRAVSHSGGLLRGAGRAAARGGLLRGAGKVAGRVGGVLGKKIPGIGLGVAGGLAAMRMMEGDQRGAAMEGLSGAMGTVPVVGTVGSLIMDGAIMGRDMIGHDRFDGFTNGVAKHVNPMSLAGIPGLAPMALAGLAASRFTNANDPARQTERSINARTAKLTPSTSDDRKEKRIEDENRQHHSKMEAMMEALVGSSNQTRENTKKSNNSLRRMADVATKPATGS